MYNYSLSPRAMPAPEFPLSLSLAATNRMAGRITPETVPILPYSEIRMFSRCPLQWRLSREYAPSFTPAALVFGGGIHAAVKGFFRARLAGRVADFGELLEAYGRHWVEAISAGNPPVRFSAKLKDADAMLNLAARMLAEFLVVARPGEVVAVDEPFVVTLAPDLPPIAGKIDLMEIREDSDRVRRLYLVDFQTAARRPAKNSLDIDRLLLFALAAGHEGWADSVGMPLALRFDLAIKKKAAEFVSVPVTPTRHGIARFVEKVRQIDRSMKKSVCYPAPSWRCSFCGFSAKCRKWPKLLAAAA